MSCPRQPFLPYALLSNQCLSKMDNYDYMPLTKHVEIDEPWQQSKIILMKSILQGQLI